MGVEQRLMTCRYRDGATRHDIHYHNAYEVTYVVSGRMNVRIDDMQYEVGPNQLVFISNFEEHHYKRSRAAAIFSYWTRNGSTGFWPFHSSYPY